MKQDNELDGMSSKISGILNRNYYTIAHDLNPSENKEEKKPDAAGDQNSDNEISENVQNQKAESEEETEDVVTKDVTTKVVVTKDEPSSIPSIPIILSEPVPSIPQPISNEPISLIVQPEQAKIKLSIITEHGKFCSRSDTFIKDLMRT